MDTQLLSRRRILVISFFLVVGGVLTTLGIFFAIGRPIERQVGLGIIMMMSSWFFWLAIMYFYGKVRSGSVNKMLWTDADDSYETCAKGCVKSCDLASMVLFYLNGGLLTSGILLMVDNLDTTGLQNVGIVLILLGIFGEFGFFMLYDMLINRNDYQSALG